MNYQNGMYNPYYGASPFNNPYQMNNFQQPQYQQQNGAMQQAQSLTNTNKIYVSGVDAVKNTPLNQNSDYIFLDNDKPLLYQKVVDSKGQFEVKIFDIVPHDAESDKKENSIDLSEYVLKKDFTALREELVSLQDSLKKISAQSQIDAIKKEYGINGTKE